MIKVLDADGRHRSRKTDESRHEAASDQVAQSAIPDQFIIV
jgi:hypothetical protein